MIVGSRRKQRGALRTHDSAGEAPPQTKHKGEVGGSQNTAPRRSERRVGPATHNVVSPVPTRCHQLSPHISCAGCAITNHSESSRMSHLRKSPLYRRQGRPRPGGHDHQSRPQERRLNTGSRLYRAMLAPAAAPPGRPRVFPQAEKTNPGGSNHIGSPGRPLRAARALTAFISRNGRLRPGAA